MLRIHRAPRPHHLTVHLLVHSTIRVIFTDGILYRSPILATSATPRISHVQTRLSRSQTQSRPMRKLARRLPGFRVATLSPNPISDYNSAQRALRQGKNSLSRTICWPHQVEMEPAPFTGRVIKQVSVLPSTLINQRRRSF